MSDLLYAYTAGAVCSRVGSATVPALHGEQGREKARHRVHRLAREQVYPGRAGLTWAAAAHEGSARAVAPAPDPAAAGAQTLSGQLPGRIARL
jgi:hypothetical protein